MNYYKIQEYWTCFLQKKMNKKDNKDIKVKLWCLVNA